MIQELLEFLLKAQAQPTSSGSIYSIVSCTREVENVNAPVSKLLGQLNCAVFIIWVAPESGLDLIPAHLKAVYQEIDNRKHLFSHLMGAMGEMSEENL